MLHTDQAERAIIAARLERKFELPEDAGEHERAAAGGVGEAVEKLTGHLSDAERVRSDQRLSDFGRAEKRREIGKTAAADLARAADKLEALEAQHRQAVADHVEAARAATVPALDPSEGAELRAWLRTQPHETRETIYNENPKAAAAALADPTNQLIRTPQYRALIENSFFDRRATPGLKAEREALARQARVLDAARFKLSDAKAAAGLLA